MKKLSLIFLLGFLMALFSCEGNKHGDIPQAPEFKVRILKVSNPEYLDNVLACYEDREGYEICYQMKWLRCGDLFLDTPPYIHLKDEYYLLNWKWQIHLCEQCVILNTLWTEVTDKFQEWDREDSYLAMGTDFFEEILYTNRSLIDEYLQITPAPPSKEWWSSSREWPKLSADHERPWFPTDSYTSVADLPDTLFASGTNVYTKSDFFAEVGRQDSLQELYVERLLTIMEQTTLEKFARARLRFDDDDL